MWVVDEIYIYIFLGLPVSVPSTNTSFTNSGFRIFMHIKNQFSTYARNMYLAYIIDLKNWEID